MNQFFLNLFILHFLFAYTCSQQNYSENSDCNNNDISGPSPAFLYTCNGLEKSCQAFLIIKSQHPFDSVPTISTLVSANPSNLSAINNVTKLTAFPANKEVIVPVSCFCSGKYYQANTTFPVTNKHGTYFTIANEAYQGLTTCDALKRANAYDEYRLLPGLELQVPLRCACPTTNQIEGGARYLITYLLGFDDNIPDIGDRFDVSTKSILDANGLEEDPVLYPSTTILIPLPNQPSSSQLIIRKNQTNISPPLSSSSPVNSASKKGVSKRVGLAAGGSLLVFSIILYALFLSYKKKADEISRSTSEKNPKQVSPEDLRVEIASFEQDLKVFEIDKIRKATEDFSSKNRIKGSVYRGMFGGEILVVKRMRTDVTSELKILKKINHFNLIKLQGVCENQGCCYFLFEYMTKGSLREWLGNEICEETGSWIKRIQIALDVANGLHYLHSFTQPAYVHMNINSNNVLLNRNFRAKIANFSLARASERENTTGALSIRVIGTRGYMAPEYSEAAYVTPKIDVYAFGVVLLELITGKDAVIIKGGREVLLSAAVVSAMGRENAGVALDSFIDRGLKGNNGTEFALRVAKVSTACLSPEPARRPSMEEVVSTLLKIQADVQKSESSSINSC